MTLRLPTRMMGRMDEPITTAQAAQRCRVTPQTIREWSAAGKLKPVLKLAGTGGLLFDPADVDRLSADAGDAA